MGNVETNEQMLTLAVFTKRKVLLGSKKEGMGGTGLGGSRKAPLFRLPVSKGIKRRWEVCGLKVTAEAREDCPDKGKEWLEAS